MNFLIGTPSLPPTLVQDFLSDLFVFWSPVPKVIDIEAAPPGPSVTKLLWLQSHLENENESKDDRQEVRAVF